MTTAERKNTITVYDLERLTCLAIEREAHNDRPETWTLEHRSFTSECEWRLERTGQHTWSRNTECIHLDNATAEQLKSTWRLNNWGAPTGARALRRIIKDLGGPDIKAPATERKAQIAADLLAQRMRLWRIAWAKQLRALMDHAGAVPEMNDLRVLDVLSAVRGELWRLTREYPECAIAVAFDHFGHPRPE